MKFKAVIFALFCSLNCSVIFSQQSQPVPIASGEQVERITRDMAKVANSVEELNKSMKEFFKTFSTNQGIKLSDKQQKLLFAFEILNRAEQRLSTLQILKVSLAERQSSVRLTIGRINDDLVPDSINKYVLARGGTINADQLKQSRRLTLEKEKIEMNQLLNELTNQIDDINSEIAQLQMFLRNIREKIFGEVSREVLDL